MANSAAATELGTLWKAHAPRLLAALAQKLRDLSAAEDALSAAFERALAWPERWPDNPGGWLYRCALNIALDQKRHKGVVERLAQSTESARHFDVDENESTDVPEHRLALFFLCAHPALSVQSQAMLMLRYCAGMGLPDIARWFHVDAGAVQRRMHRSVHKLQQAGVRFDLPHANSWPERLPSVLSAIEIIYDQSYSDVGGGYERDGLASDAEMLALTLVEQLRAEPEVLGLAAMILLAESRRGARIDAEGMMIPLDCQNPARWDFPRIQLAAKLISKATQFGRAGPYQIRAMIFAQHARRRELGRTPWAEIVLLYQALFECLPSVQVEINQLLAQAKLGATSQSLRRLRALIAEGHATQAHFLALAALLAEERQFDQAIEAMQRARQFPTGTAEARYLDQQIQSWQALIAT